MFNWFDVENGATCMVNAVQWSITGRNGKFFSVSCGRTLIKIFEDCNLSDVKTWVEQNA